MASVTIELPTDTERRLREHATREGQSLESYLQRIAERALASFNGTPVADQQRMSFEELTAPIAGAVAFAGASDEDVEALFNEAVAEVRAERRARSPSTS